MQNIIEERQEGIDTTLDEINSHGKVTRKWLIVVELNSGGEVIATEDGLMKSFIPKSAKRHFKRLAIRLGAVIRANHEDHPQVGHVKATLEMFYRACGVLKRNACFVAGQKECLSLEGQRKGTIRTMMKGNVDGHVLVAVSVLKMVRYLDLPLQGNMMKKRRGGPLDGDGFKCSLPCPMLHFTGISENFRRAWLDNYRNLFFRNEKGRPAMHT